MLISLFDLRLTIVYIVFIILNFIYFQNFTIYHAEIYNDTYFFENFYFAFNSDHDKSYVHHFQRLVENYRIGDLSIQNGISYFYYFLSLIFKFDKSNILITSFIVNNIFVIVGYIYFSKIKTQILKLNKNTNYLYFLNPLLIWHSQLINKDMIIMALVLMVSFYIYKKRIIFVAIISGFIFLVRYFLGLIAPATLLALKIKNQYLIVFIFYTIIMFLTAYIYSQSERTIFLINRMYPGREFEMGVTGISSLVVHINFNYFYSGNFLLGPAKAMAYLYDLIRCYDFIHVGRINLHLLFHIPIVTYFLYNLRTIFAVLINLEYLKEINLWPLFLIMIILFFVFLGSPLVHARYLFIIFYLLVLIIMKWNSNMRAINAKK